MKKLFVLIALCAFGFLMPELLLAQANNSLPKKMVPSQNNLTSSKDSAVVSNPSVGAKRINTTPVKSTTADSAKILPLNEALKRVRPATTPVDEKNPSSPPAK